MPEGYTLRPNAFIAIAPDGKVSFQIPQEEMGQGVYTSLSQLLADELDVDFAQVTPLPAPPVDEVYGSPRSHRMMTGGSTSIRSFYTALREVGASGRAMLVEAAARQWNVKPESLRTENGFVIDDAHGGRKLSYGGLAPKAAKLPAPQKVTLKADKDLKLIGKSVKRLDTPDKVNGKAQFGIDVRMDGLKIATLAASPVVGGKVAHVDDSKLKAMPGVQLVVLDDIVAVVGPHFWAAKKGLDALTIAWDGGANAKMDSAVMWKELRDTAMKAGVVAKEDGDAPKALAGGDRIDVAYELPFLSHAPMEPQNFTVHVRDGGCEMWGGSQVQTGAVAAAAKTLNTTPDKILFHNYMLGGGFGRRLDTDMVVKSVRIAQKVDGPVKVIWTREEDIQQDMYRPAYRNVMSAGLGKDGKITAWTHRIAGGAVSVRMSGKPLKGGLDRGSLEGAVGNEYGIPNFRVEYIEAEPRALNIGYWRGVAPNNNVFATESLMDELALKAGQDPIAFRLAQLDGTPRLKAAVQMVAQKSDWGGRLAQTGGLRRLRPVRLRHLYRHRHRGRGGRNRPGPYPQGAFGDRCRPHGQSRHVDGAGAGRVDVRLHRGALWRHHGEGWTRRTEEFQRLPDDADQRGPGYRGAHHQERRGARRHRRTGLYCRPAIPGQRHRGRDRGQAAQASHRP